MRAHALALACAALLCASVRAAEAPSPLANDALVHSARLWEAHDRGDLAKLALEKLVASRPDSPEALRELGELHLRMADVPAAAQVLKTLQTRFPEASTTRTFALQYRLSTRDRLQLASIQRLLQLSRGAEARREIDRVFGAPPTEGSIAIEYYRLLAGTPNGWQPARVGLERLVARNPDDPRYRVALAQLLLRHDETEQQGLRQLFELMSRDDVRPREMDDALSSAIDSVGARNVPDDILRDHLSRHPDDQGAKAALAQRALASEEAALLASQALQRVRPDLQTKNLDAAEKALRADQPHVQALFDALRHRELHGSVDDALLASVQWQQRANAALQAGDRAVAALELQGALAFARHEYERVIALADALDALHADAAGALLATASRLDPQSDWLFGTYMRWLIAHDRAADALPLLEARSAKTKDRNELLATALDARARQAIEAGNIGAARADLERAIGLQPDDVWMRYRLAGLYARSGEAPRGSDLLRKRVDAEPANEEARYAYALFLASIDEQDAALVAIDAVPTTPRMQALRQRIVRERAMTHVRTLQREGRFVEAAQALDALLAEDASDRSLRVARADLAMEAGETRDALDRYAALVAEDPDDIDTRLAYVGALTRAKQRELALMQLQAARERIAATDADHQLTLARRQWELGDSTGALQSLHAVLEVRPNDALAMVMLARIELSLGHYAAANGYFQRAETADDVNTAASARAARAELNARLESWATAGFEVRHKPGDGGISRFDSIVMPSLWQFARDYDSRVWIHADAVTLDAGHLSRDYDDAALFGTIQANGPNAVRRHDNDRQSGMSLGVGYTTDEWSADIGTTPLGFLLPQIVGGFEWSPRIPSLDVAVGLSRRALTSSVLSYAGMRDPITGEKWGGVVDNGVYAQGGVYRERYSVSGSMRISKITGDDVPDNDFIGARVGADWKVIAWPSDRAYAGVALTYWKYERDLGNYTFGSGGYYSPHSYWSIALPVEWQGSRAGWSYRLRAAVSHSASRTERTPFYEGDALQAAAGVSVLPSGYDEPFFDGGRSTGTSLSAYAAVERNVTDTLVLGAKLDIDRADYYNPTVLSLYVRHAFGARRTDIVVPPRPVRPYSEQR